MENIDVDTRVECNEVGGEWDQDADICWQYQEEGFGESAPIDGVNVSYVVQEYPGGYIPMARISSPDGGIHFETEGHEQRNAESAENNARSLASSVARDLEQAAPGSNTYDGLKKFQIGPHEVIAKSRSEALDVIEEAAQADLPSDQRRF